VRKSLFPTLLIVAAVTSTMVFAAGCGNYQGESNPREAAQKVLDLVKSHQYAEARKYFMKPVLLDTVIGTLGDKKTSLGQGEFADSHAGGYPVYLDGNSTTPLMWFHVWRVQYSPDKWKIKSVNYPYVPQSSLGSAESVRVPRTDSSGPKWQYKNVATDEGAIVEYRVWQDGVFPDPAWPAANIYGNGTRIMKVGAYEYVQGQLVDGPSSVLERLWQDGYFKLQGSYSGSQPYEQIYVYLDTGHILAYSKSVTVHTRGVPGGWDRMVDAISEAKTKSTSIFSPREITVCADSVKKPPAGMKLLEWPDSLGDLARATNYRNYPYGMVLKDEFATEAWKLLSSSYIQYKHNVVWRCKGIYYEPVSGEADLPGLRAD
jgi:hypothetical protein